MGVCVDGGDVVVREKENDIKIVCPDCSRVFSINFSKTKVYQENIKYKENEKTHTSSELKLNLVCVCGCNKVVFKERTTTEGMGYFCIKCGEYRYSGCL